MNDAPTIDQTDITSQSWVERMPKGLRPYLILMRADRPIGTWLLLFPCWWSLALATQGIPNLTHAALFALGAFIMRGAGCVMNDLADQNLDAHVARTKTRPLPNGDVSPKQAMAFMGFLCLLGLGVLIQFNSFTIYLGMASLGLIVLYPFCKRWTYWPQAILGLTFNWGALVGWSAHTAELALPAVCIYLAGLFWTLGYDTIYAHQDKQDDQMVGIKSTALKLGDNTVAALWGFYAVCLILITLAGYLAHIGWPFYVALSFTAAHLVWQIRKLDIHNPQNCLALFKSNKWFGWILLATILLGKLPV